MDCVVLKVPVSEAAQRVDTNGADQAKITTLIILPHPKWPTAQISHWSWRGHCWHLPWCALVLLVGGHG